MNENEMQSFIASFKSLSDDYQRVVIALVNTCSQLTSQRLDKQD